MIIWATDGSSGAERALQFAKGLAQGEGARLVVVHVKEIMVGRTGGYPVNVEEGQVQAAIRNRSRTFSRKDRRDAPDGERGGGRRGACDRGRRRRGGS